MKKLLILIMISIISFNAICKKDDSKKEEKDAEEGVEQVGEALKKLPPLE